MDSHRDEPPDLPDEDLSGQPLWRSLRTTLAACALLCVLASCPSQTWGMERVDYQGLQNYLAANKGVAVLVNYWSTACPPCLKEIPGLMALRVEIPQDQLHIVGVSLDFDPGAAQRYIENTRLNYPSFLADPDILSQLDSPLIPQTMLYDRQGALIVNHEGYLSLEALRSLVEQLPAAP